MKIVYFDVENTLDVPFITGIQRVTREFSKTVLGSKPISDTLLFKPVLYDHQTACWRNLSPYEVSSLKSDVPRSTSLHSRVVNKLRRLVPVSSSLFIKYFEVGSIFLDIDSSWHSKLKRSALLPTLKRDSVKIAKLHYDIIPLLFSETSHPNTVNVFKEHFLSHLKYADLFICISEKTKEDVVNYCEQESKPPPNAQVVSLGSSSVPSNEALSHQRQLETLSQLGVSTQTPYIISVGTIEPRKNFAFLVKAFEKLISTTSLNLVIVGKIGWQAEEIITKFENHNFYQTRIFHFKDISDQQLDILYRNAWLNVVASHYEGFGLPVVESLSRGCATISSHAGSLKEVGGKDVRFFSPDSENQLTDLIEELYSNPDKHDELLYRASKHKIRKWPESIKNIVNHLEELASAP